MKAISLWQPYASAIPAGLKSIETRGWRTHFRGRLAIHAAQKNSAALRTWWDACVLDKDNKADFIHEAALAFAKIGIEKVQDMPFGCIVATCTLYDCLSTAELVDRGLVKAGSAEHRFGDYRQKNDKPGENGKPRFGWLLRDVVALPHPVPCKGKQGFFEWPDSQCPESALRIEAPLFPTGGSVFSPLL